LSENADIVQLHTACECIVRVANAPASEAIQLSHKGCQLTIRGALLAIDCDRCSAFGPSDTKPDLLVLRRTESGLEWLVVEIKQVMDSGARQQVRAGIDRLYDSAMFEPTRDASCGGLFASKKANRTADVDALRKPFARGGRRIEARVVRCGSGLRL